MNWWRFTMQNIKGSLFRSAAILISAALVSGLVLGATVVIGQARQNMQASLGQLGADVIVIPFGTMVQGLEGARLMSQAREHWMPRAYMDRVAAVPGVEAVSPQLYLGAVPQDQGPDIYVVSYEPQTDFTLEPWLDRPLSDGLPLGSAVAGSDVPAEEIFDLYGYPLQLVRRLVHTNTDVDRSLFVSFETGQDIAGKVMVGPKPFTRPAPASITSVMVRAELGTDPHTIALRVHDQVPSVIPVENPQLFQSERRQLVGLIRTVAGLLVVTWLLALLFIGLTFTLVVNERQREIGVLRALGATRRAVMRGLLSEGALLALLGGTLGLLFTALVLRWLAADLQNMLGMPFQPPDAAPLLALALGTLVVTLLSVLLAAFIPSMRIYRLEVSLAMRE